ncbi:cob(I)yrinic acid a,c-diamide adenosyltransferase [Salmonella enterica subsp. arizonae]|nr:cob(I)yrinic acid a,c-diamide adenosyltransferase [Salmonella enterica]ECE6100977.1 cob(I)yrinic acid a,c-diamide adenosyltransferase [Salmonella enterica subsp. arizonae]ECT9555395.1 cob(I)yrinic acid a,c-diamide adenosyltransferase [Salmonella enterica subsp. arizonae serovar 41:z4,z23:-]EDS4371374.1 cob(I)yrinic acid a,c-diamide adenosyltransferase [Salmonella enterica subsp. enterica serovar Waycross]ECF5960042.1 cob(I)yrinic acid a,c-diamide adenosyltransferase [Salmonella enterica subs
MAIYTRTGDAGTTALFSGQRVSKTHPRVEAYGTLDELNAALSLCACTTHHPQHRRFIESIQQQIFWFSAELASESEQPNPGQRYISTEEIAVLEAAIDAAMSRVAVVHSFILPGRCEAASRLHFARTLARRAERRLVELSADIAVRQVLMRYINRLSDCLYALARAEELHVPVVISIVDGNGTPTVTWRMPDALLVSSELAPKKAWTAVAMKSATHELASAVQPGAALYGLDTHMQGKIVTFGGGFALWRNGVLIGGLGISGGSVEQDMDIAQAAIAAIDVRTYQ